MKETSTKRITILLLAMVIAASAMTACGHRTETAPPTESSNAVESSDSTYSQAESSVESSTYDDESSSYSTDESSRALPAYEPSAAEESVSEESMSASELRAYLNEIFLDQNLGVVYRALEEAYGKQYLKEHFEFYDYTGESVLGIIEKDNWTIREWKLSNGQFQLGCEKTAYGIDSLNNMLESITSSKAYQAMSTLADIADTADSLGIGGDDEKSN